jgi:uncharacterized membrane protein
MNKRKWIPLAVLGIAVVMVILMITSLLLDSYKGPANSNGERIYFTATNDRGQRITYTGGPSFGGMMRRRQLTCAYCHGIDGSGGQYFIHMQQMDAPDMRWAALSGPDTFLALVVDGKRPNGEPMSSSMPRWNLNDEDMADLADFIAQTLDSEKGKNKMMFPGQFMMSGWLEIIAIIGFPIVVIIIIMKMRRGGFWSDRHGSWRDHVESRDSDSALDILKKRYAKGEISKEEFDQIKKDL